MMYRDFLDELPDNNQDKNPQKLIEILGEVLFLRDRLAQLEEEAERLKEDIGR